MGHTPQEGEPFPDLALVDHNGNDRLLSELVAGGSTLTDTKRV